MRTACGDIVTVCDLCDVCDASCRGARAWSVQMAVLSGCGRMCW
jgi:hypothetical protein